MSREEEGKTNSQWKKGSEGNKESEGEEEGPFIWEYTSLAVSGPEFTRQNE